MIAFLYYFGLSSSYFIKLIFTKTEVFYESPEKRGKKLKGRSVIIANHRSPLDALVIAHKYFFRRLYFIAANFWHGKLKFFRFFVKLIGGVLLERETRSYRFLMKAKSC